MISVAPLLIACGDGALEIVTGQAGDGITMQGSQLAQTLGLVQGSRLNSQPVCAARRRTRVLILGVNGFIGNHLTERLLREDHYEVYGLDIGSDAISRFRIIRIFTLSKAISVFIPNGLSITSKNVMSSCLWWR